MSLRGHRSFRERIFTSRVTPFAGLLLVAALLVPVVERFQAEREMAARRAAAEAERAELANRAAALRENVEYLATPAGREEVFRVYYDMAKPGEEVIVFTATETDASATDSTSAATSAAPTLWQRFTPW